jgi:hypothetical protein
MGCSTRSWMRVGALITCLGLQMALSATEQQTEITVPSRSVTQLGLAIRMREGNLILSAGAEDLVRSIFTHDSGQEKPQLQYVVGEDKAEIEIKNRGSAEQWEIYPTRAVPLDLMVEAQKGNRRLVLDELQLRQLKLEVATGNTSISMGGHQTCLEEIWVRQGTGDFEIDLRGDYPKLRKVKIDVGSGEANLNLNGKWSGLSEVEVTVERGNVSVLLPRQIPAKVIAEAPTGEIITKRRSEVADVRAAETQEPTFVVKIHNQCGNIFLETAAS